MLKCSVDSSEAGASCGIKEVSLQCLEPGNEASIGPKVVLEVLLDGCCNVHWHKGQIGDCFFVTRTAGLREMKRNVMMPRMPREMRERMVFMGTKIH